MTKFRFHYVIRISDQWSGSIHCETCYFVLACMRPVWRCSFFCSHEFYFSDDGHFSLEVRMRMCDQLICASNLYLCPYFLLFQSAFPQVNWVFEVFRLYLDLVGVRTILRRHRTCLMMMM